MQTQLVHNYIEMQSFLYANLKIPKQNNCVWRILLQTGIASSLPYYQTVTPDSIVGDGSGYINEHNEMQRYSIPMLPLPLSALSG